jgi:hypothetical protein
LVVAATNINAAAIEFERTNDLICTFVILFRFEITVKRIIFTGATGKDCHGDD